MRHYLLFFVILTSCSLLLDAEKDFPSDSPTNNQFTQGFCSGSSLGSMAQTDDQGNTNAVVLGDSTPPLIDSGGIEQSSEEFRNLVGFISTQY